MKKKNNTTPSFKRLSNGISYVYEHLPKSNSTTIRIAIKAGSLHDDVGGTAHFLEHMLFNGTKKYPNAIALRSQLDSLGGYYNASTDYENIIIKATVINQKADIALNILSDMVLHPILEEEYMNKERKIILSEAKQSEDDDDHTSYYAARKCIYLDNNGKKIIGTNKSIKSITLADLKKYHKKYFVGNNICISIAGGSGDMFTHVQEIFQNTKSGKTSINKLPMLSANKNKEYIISKDRGQSLLTLYFDAYQHNSIETYPTVLLSNMLGAGLTSRLMRKLREQMGITYGANSFYYSWSTLGMFGISVETKSKNNRDAINAIMHELNDIAENGPADIEMQTYIDMTTCNLLMSMESSSDFANYNLSFLLHNEEYKTVDFHINKYHMTTKEDIQKVAQDLLRRNKVIITIG